MRLNRLSPGIAALLAGAGGGPPPDPGDAIVMPLGIRNYGASTVSSGAIVQFGVPISQARGLDLATLAATMARDSDSTPIPVQLDLTSTTRLGGDLCYVVGTAKMPFSIAATTTVDCTVTLTPGGTYSGGSETVTSTNLEARDFKVEATGDDITGTGTASFNDYVWRRKIKSGACETGWEGWSRVKVAGVAQGKWGVHWRVMGKANAALTDWRVEVNVFCSDVVTSSFSSSPYGKSGSFTLKAGSTTLTSSGSVFVSGATGFAMRQSGHVLLPAYGGATLRPVHDRAYLVAEKAIWPFRWAADGYGTFGTTYTPGSIGGFASTWGAGGIDGRIGPMSADSYNMLLALDDDTAFTTGYVAGLCQLSVAIHQIDPATGFFRPKFGSYAGMGTADSSRVTFLTTYNSSGAATMAAEFGHYCDTAFVPALLTGDMAFQDGLHAWAAKMARRQPEYNRPQVSGRTRREFPFLYQWDESTLSRYDDWPHRDLLHYLYLCPDDHPDKAYAKAAEAETAAWGQDIYVDFLAWTSTGAGVPTNAFDAGLWDGNKTTSTTNFWALALNAWSAENAYSAGDAAAAAGWRADAPWCADFRGYVMWLAAARNGEAYPQAVYDTFFGRYMIGRAVGSGACVAYLADAFNPVAVGAGGAVSQTWSAMWQDQFDGAVYPPTHRTVCPTTAAPDEVAKVAHKYVSVLALLHRLGFAAHGGKTYQDAYVAVQACFGGAGADWDETPGGRWVMEPIA